jgi:hypothetical protein
MKRPSTEVVLVPLSKKEQKRIRALELKHGVTLQEVIEAGLSERERRLRKSGMHTLPPGPAEK